MRLIHGFALAAAVALLVPTVQGAPGQDMGKPVAGGGIFAKGWTGKIDASAVRQGQTINDAKFTEENGGFHIMTGPATSYWNPADTASGNYTVKATFTEPKFMNLMSHSHPYGVFIAGNKLGTDQESLLYCAAYGTGMFIVRGFGPAPFQLNGREGEANAAVHKAAGPGQPVTQEIALSVKGDKIDCAINGTVVGSYPVASLVAPGRLTSSDGMYGIRVAHNIEVDVTNFGMTQP